MRQGLPALLLALSPCLVATSTMAEGTPSSVIAIDDALFTKQSELQTAQQATHEQQVVVNSYNSELDRLTKQAQSFDKALAKAKADIERDYMKMIDDPELDIMPSQNAYQAAWANVKQNQKARLEAEQKRQESEALLAQKRAEQSTVSKSIIELEQHKLRARVERLRDELKQSSTEKVSFTNACDADMTLAQCSKQTTDLALQKAVNQYQSKLIEAISEAKLVKQHLANVSFNIHVLRHKAVDSGFYNGNKYKAVLDVQLDARPDENTPCKLLNVESQYCFAPGEYSVDTEKQKEIAWVTLSIRSNQYSDKVSIDNVNYGNTPVEVMLPVGLHMITIEKEGYHSFHQELKITSDHTLRANLREKDNLLKPGHKFADSLKGGNKAPELVTLISGEYLIGEHASKQIFLDHAFAFGSTPVTVGQFETFVNQTTHQTDAELQKLCTAVSESEITPIAGSYWRDPGFKQLSNSPVVCISQNDAKSYTRWLSKETGYKYRLPTEEEWEIAARAGTQTDYWWGDDFGTGKANTGWSGTPWSNKSTSPVKSFAPNSLGLYDVVGNVWEWTNDSRGQAKGGAWSFSPATATAYGNLFIAPATSANYVGFRVIREL
jgi:formylglycine-generating enzyme required for sulfatase activity